MELEIPIPRDQDGFVRRQCPRCERVFKWRVSDDERDNPRNRTENFCPYCGIASPTDEFWTNEQVEALQSAAGDAALRDLALRGFKVSMTPPPPPLVEPNDMDTVASPCHPTEPVKIIESWDGPIYCLVCGLLFIA